MFGDETQIAENLGNQYKSGIGKHKILNGIYTKKLLPTGNKIEEINPVLAINKNLKENIIEQVNLMKL